MCLKLYLSLLPRVLPPRRPFLVSAEGRLLPGFMLAVSPNWAHGVFLISPSLRRKRSSDLDGVPPGPLASFLIAASRSALADLPFSPPSHSAYLASRSSMSYWRGLPRVDALGSVVSGRPLQAVATEVGASGEGRATTPYSPRRQLFHQLMGLPHHGVGKRQ